MITDKPSRDRDVFEALANGEDPFGTAGSGVDKPAAVGEPRLKHLLVTTRREDVMPNS